MNSAVLCVILSKMFIGLGWVAGAIVGVTGSGTTISWSSGSSLSAAHFANEN